MVYDGKEQRTGFKARGGVKKLSLVSKFIQNPLFGGRRKEEEMTSPAGKQLVNILAKH